MKNAYHLKPLRFIFICLSIVFSYQGNLIANEPLPFYEGVKAYKQGQYQHALDWFTQSAEKGDAEAMFLLGRMYYDGNSISINYVTALMWFQLAAKEGLKVARRYYKGLSKRMSKHQIQQAKSLAQKWNSNIKEGGQTAPGLEKVN